MTPARSSSPSVPPGDARAAFARPAPLVGFLALLALLVLSQFYGALVLGPAAVAELDGGPGSAGLIQSVFGISYAAGFLVWGPLVDRFGATRMLLLGLAVLAVTTGLVALAPGLPWLIAARIAQGAAAASFAPAAFAHVGAHLPPPARAAAITVFTSAFLAAAVLGQVAAQAVAEALSWRWFFGGSAILLAAALVVAVTRLRADGPLGPAPASPLRTLLRLLGSGAIPPLLLATLAILGPFTAVYAALGQAGPVAGGS
ncbi:MFS transporter, partial [Leucobacter sp. M11]|uniref:MFS transporter n=1 Tax=Leucobacter sp. M11 TaxID=2993565 RepID=UPI002D80E866